MIAIKYIKLMTSTKENMIDEVICYFYPGVLLFGTNIIIARILFFVLY